MRRRRRSESSGDDEIRFGRRSNRSDLGGEILEGTASDLASFGDTGSEGFADAWSSSGETSEEESFGFGADNDDDRSRDLDRRFRLGRVLIGVFVLVGAGLAWAAWQGVFDADSQAANEASLTEQLVAPGAPRTYATSPRNIDLDTWGVAQAMYRADAAGEEPMPLGTDDPRAIRFGTVLWGGRTHVAITSATPFDTVNECIVVTLATSDLRVLDLASVGSCAESFVETGDRLACSGDHLVMLEVWANDPSALVPKSPVELLRVRVERERSDGSVESTRGEFALIDSDDGSPLAESSAVLGAAPNNAVAISFDGDSRTCGLIDRKDVIVRLLPG